MSVIPLDQFLPLFCFSWPWFMESLCRGNCACRIFLGCDDCAFRLFLGCLTFFLCWSIRGEIIGLEICRCFTSGLFLKSLILATGINFCCRRVLTFPNAE